MAGKQYADATIIECANCHAKLSDAQKDHPPRIDHKPPTTFERVGHLLLGLADLLRLAAAKLDEVGRALIQYAADMDKRSCRRRRVMLIEEKAKPRNLKIAVRAYAMPVTPLKKRATPLFRRA